MSGDALVLVEREEPIAVVTLNRPNQLNALSEPLMEELVERLLALDRDAAIRCIVLAGSERAFAAGADIAELAKASPVELLYARRVERWDAIRRLRTPLVAAVSGFCLGGGNELAMSADLVVASETARFGQPETGLGIIPGAGGTQRLTRAIGKSKTMDVILTGRFLDAREAERAGLVALGSIAYHCLMVSAGVAGDFNAALVYGWRAFEGAAGDPAREAEMLINVSQFLY
ncbi:MAG: enoyl-CoA hydratase-related protein, partial [Actinomycetota bacterium]|nr:enoyl-CoA hydratase-related protein [Actinomycetota bacterium]